MKLDDNWGKKRGGNISGSKNDIRQRLVYARKFKKITYFRIRNSRKNK